MYWRLLIKDSNFKFIKTTPVSILNEHSNKKIVIWLKQKSINWNKKKLFFN